MTDEVPSSSLVPLYRQVSDALADRIASNELPPGSALPGEFDLCQSFGVSRITIRKALEELVARRMVIRRRGIGTFVADTNEIRWSVTLTGVIEDVLMPNHMTVLSESSGSPPRDVLDFAGVGPGHEFKVIQGVNYSPDGAPLVRVIYYFPPDVASLVAGKDLSGPTQAIRVVEQATGRRADHAQQVVEPLIADARIAKSLELPEGSAVLRVIRVFFDTKQRPIEIFDAAYHPKHYRYTATLYPRPK